LKQVATVTVALDCIADAKKNSAWCEISVL